MTDNKMIKTETEEVTEITLNDGRGGTVALVLDAAPDKKKDDNAETPAVATEANW